MSCIKFIKSYLDNNIQKVRLSQCESDVEENSNGTILTPLFFIGYVNGMLISMTEKN